jgi:hypothetical protein
VLWLRTPPLYFEDPTFSCQPVVLPKVYCGFSDSFEANFCLYLNLGHDNFLITSAWYIITV